MFDAGQGTCHILGLHGNQQDIGCVEGGSISVRWQSDPKVGQSGDSETVSLYSLRVTWSGNHSGVYPMPREMSGDNRTHTSSSENHNPHIDPPFLLARDYGGSGSILSTKARMSMNAPGSGPDTPATDG